jgi:hypothetical protein
MMKNMAKGGVIQKDLFRSIFSKKYFELYVILIILFCKTSKTIARSLFYSSGWSGEILFTPFHPRHPFATSLI